MKQLGEINRILHEHQIEFRENYGVSRVGVFGSFARGEERPGSDLDILVEFQRPVGLLTFMRLEHRLEEITGAGVELVTRKALKPYIGANILEEVRYVKEV